MSKKLDDVVSKIITETVDTLKMIDRPFNDLETQEQGNFVTNMKKCIESEIGDLFCYS